MSFNTTTLTDEILDYNRRLDAALNRRYGISVRLYKIIKAITQLVGAAAGILAMQNGAPPLATFALIALVIVGPEGFERVLYQDRR